MLWFTTVHILKRFISLLNFHIILTLNNSLLNLHTLYSMRYFGHVFKTIIIIVFIIILDEKYIRSLQKHSIYLYLLVLRS